MRPAKAQRLRYRLPASSRAFALIELIVVAGLLIVLFVVYMGRGSVQFQKQQQAVCRQNLQIIHVALLTFATDHSNKFPADAFAKNSEAVLDKLVPQYTTRTDVFTCPGTKEPKLPQGKSFKDRKISYSYLMGLTTKAPNDQWILADWLLDTKAHEKGDLIFSSDGKKPGNNHEKFGGVILFIDGNAEITKPKAAFPITIPTNTKILNPAR